MLASSVSQTYFWWVPWLCFMCSPRTSLLDSCGIVYVPLLPYWHLLSLKLCYHCPPIRPLMFRPIANSPTIRKLRMHSPITAKMDHVVSIAWRKSWARCSWHLTSSVGKLYELINVFLTSRMLAWCQGFQNWDTIWMTAITLYFESVLLSHGGISPWTTFAWSLHLRYNFCHSRLFIPHEKQTHGGSASHQFFGHA